MYIKIQTARNDQDSHEDLFLQMSKTVYKATVNKTKIDRELKQN